MICNRSANLYASSHLALQSALLYGDSPDTDVALRTVLAAADLCTPSVRRGFTGFNPHYT